MGLTRERPGAEGPVRIAPAGRPSQDDSGIPPGSIPSEPSAKPDRRIGEGPIGPSPTPDQPSATPVQGLARGLPDV